MTPAEKSRNLKEEKKISFFLSFVLNVHFKPLATKIKGDNNQAPKKKRVHRSCEPCRNRKIKCNRLVRCESCLLHGVECYYKEAKPILPEESENLLVARKEILRLNLLVKTLQEELSISKQLQYHSKLPLILNSNHHLTYQQLPSPSPSDYSSPAPLPQARVAHIYSPSHSNMNSQTQNMSVQFAPLYSNSTFSIPSSTPTPTTPTFINPAPMSLILPQQSYKLDVLNSSATYLDSSSALFQPLPQPQIHTSNSDFILLPDNFLIPTLDSQPQQQNYYSQDLLGLDFRSNYDFLGGSS